MAVSLTVEEQNAIAALRRLAKRWPRSLLLFSGGCGLTVRKPRPGEFYDVDTIVADITGIPCDGGDGGDERTRMETGLTREQLQTMDDVREGSARNPHGGFIPECSVCGEPGCPDHM